MLETGEIVGHSEKQFGRPQAFEMCRMGGEYWWVREEVVIHELN